MKTIVEEQFQSPEPEELKRIRFGGLKGWYSDDGIPYAVYYILDCPTNDLVNEKDPGKSKLTPNLGPKINTGYSLSIFIHKSVPPEFRDVVFFHEIEEAKHIYGERMDKKQAHQLATKATEEYIKNNLSKKEGEEFIKWQKTLGIN